jgi:hypothetical protein
MTTRGTPGPTCGARTRAGGTCQNPPMAGATRCRLHGGATPNAQAAAAERRAEQAAAREVARIAITPFVSIGLNDGEDERAFEVVVEGTTEETP